MKRILALLCAGLCIIACGTQKKVTRIRKESTGVQISLPREKEVQFRDIKSDYRPADTLTVVDMDGHQQLIMNAIRDDETGEMVATETIEAAMVTARFRNVAERHGKVDIEFQIRVPHDLFDPAWQIRFYPRMVVLEDTLNLDHILITGNQYRREQDKGYMRYRRFMESIVTDSTEFIHIGQFELFIERNIPALYMFKQDSSYVMDEQFESCFGVDEEQAIEHYTNKFRRWFNNWKKDNVEVMYRRYIKSPIVTDHLKLDTVIQAMNGDFIYNYTQTIQTRPKLRKVEVFLSGDIYEQERHIYGIPQAEPLTFYISSLSAFVDNTERYLSRILSRKVEENTACYIEFKAGSDAVIDTMGNNAPEIDRIKGNLASLVRNTEFDLDSIVVVASASPEGTYSFNRNLSSRRGAGVSRYFESYVRRYVDSLKREEGFRFNLDEEYNGGGTLEASDIRFISHSEPENWRMLDALVRNDVVMDDGDKEEYFSHEGMEPDAREAAMRSDRQYKYYREVLYPKVRIVKFAFHLHRKGMIQDTVLTTVLDTAYMNGVQAIRDRDYEKAITLLRPYNDYNTAIAYCSMDYNASAMAVLEKLERTAPVNYMLAVLHSRKGEDREAVECYLRSCQQDPSYVFRGNLDPEISALIKQYGLNKEEYTEE
ncbi:MAG: hypothetical protein KBS73_00615 [Bacteroidales bacterium]|nr:hypothetical protein [Candidatus Cacconaster equifaecalis]